MKECEKGTSLHFEYEFSNFERIYLTNERFKVPELMFNPSILGKEDDSVQVLITKSIGECSEEIRNELYSNIVISGGNTLFEGFAERL